MTGVDSRDWRGLQGYRIRSWRGIVDDIDFWIESGHQLILNPNVVVKLKSGSTKVLADGVYPAGWNTVDWRTTNRSGE